MERIGRAAAAATTAVLATALTLASASVPVPAELIQSTSTSTVRITGAPDEAWVIWHDGPSGSRRNGVTEHYVICVPASNPDGPLAEYLVDEVEAYPAPDPAGRTRFSEGEPCPYGRLRS